MSAGSWGGACRFQRVHSSGRGGRDALLAHRVELEARNSEAAAPTWRHVYRFLEDWSDRASPLHQTVPFVWIEFDLHEGLTEVPSPFLLFFLQERVDERVPAQIGTPLRPARTREACRELVGRGLSRLRGRAVVPAVEHRVAICLEALPSDGHLAYAAALTSRSPEAVRLTSMLPSASLVPYLCQIGWRGNVAQVEEALGKLGLNEGFVWFDLDVDAETPSSLGVIFHYPDHAPQWQRSLDWLVTRGACAPEKRDAVLAWPGWTEALLPGHRWPCVVKRGMAAKLVLRSDLPAEAKIYLDLRCKLALFR